MNEGKISFNDVVLSEDEYVLIEAFVKGPMYPVYMKILEGGIKQWQQVLCTSLVPNELFQMQGRIQAARYLQNVPAILAQVNHQRKVPNE